MNATNKVIAKVAVVKTGTTEYGKWTLYNIHFEGSERKFGYMGNDKKPVPFVGMKVPYLEYDEEEKEKDGKVYKNYNIKELKVDETQAAPASSSQSTGPAREEKKAYIDHGKVMVDILQMAGGERDKVFELVDLFNKGIDMMLNPKPIEKSKQVGGHGPDDFDPNDIPLDAIPF